MSPQWQLLTFTQRWKFHLPNCWPTMECRDSCWLLWSFPTQRQQPWRLNSRILSDISSSSDVSPCSWAPLCLASWPSGAITKHRLFPAFINEPWSTSTRFDSAQLLTRKLWLLSSRQLLLDRITWCTVGASDKIRNCALQHWIDSFSQIWRGAQRNRRRKSCPYLFGPVHWLAVDDTRKRLICIILLNNCSVNSKC